ncbi:MAG: fibronectin type III domain-containing protein [Ferruginibacter sp.]|nr:fibronectin type III domain-containing protein [Ferruginibacter sp.]
MTRTLFLSCLLAFVTTSLLAQTPVVPAKKRTTAITINGNPNETAWQFTNNVTKTIIGSPNNTVKYAVLWDSLNLYVAVTVTDANKFNESANGWDDDAVEVFIDADNNGGTVYGVNDRQFVKEWNSATLWEKNNKTANIQHAWSNITNGYAIEMSIPWSSIGITNPAQGFTIGFDIANDDDDNGGVRESQLQWAGDNNNWQYTQNFGDLVLSSNDTQAPSAPANLSTSALTQSSISLNWVASTDNIGVSGYDVFRNGTKINTSLVNSTSYNVTGLSAATAYQFYIQARDAAGNTSASSNTVNITTPDTQAPAAPTALASSNLTAVAVTLSWIAATDNIGVSGYDVFRNGTKINASLVTTTSLNVTGLTNASTYQFYVQAKDAAGNTSANSNIISVTTPDNQPPTAPSNLIASNILQSSLQLTWNASGDNTGISGYDIYRNGTKLNTSLVLATLYNVSGLSASTAYQFYVVAKDAAGNSSVSSNIVSVITPDTQAPSAPSDLLISSLTQTSFTMSWNASTDNVGIAGYDIYQDGVKINAALVIATSYNATSLTASTSYQYYVQARDAAGNATNSSILNLTTPAPPDSEAPSTPVNLTASNIAQNSADLNWTASTDNVAVTGYDIYQDNIKIAATSAAYYHVTGLSALVTYNFYIVAKDGAGNLSAGSNAVTTITPDTETPVAATNLIASGINQTSLVLNWSAGTDNTSVAGYDIYQDNIKISAAIVTATSFNVTGLNSSSTYNFYVRTLDAAGNSSNSNSINITTPAPPDLQAPSAIADLVSSGILQSSVVLSWTATTDNVGVTGYDIYQNNVKIGSASGTVTSYTATGLTALNSYNFYVIAKDAAGNISASSNIVTVTTPDTQVPTAPASLISSSLTATSVSLNWTASTDNIGVTGYNVYQNNVKVNAVPVNGISYNVTGLAQASVYSFFVKAIDNAGNISAGSNTVTISTPDTNAPTAPANLVSSVLTATTLTLGWLASSDNVAVAGYDVYRNGVKINTGVITATSYSVTGLTAATLYSFYIQAKDAAGNISANSNTLNITTTAAPACTATGTIAYQKWNGVSGTTVASLTSIAAYPNSPSVTGTLTSFEIPSAAGDNYGIRVNGYICPPATGAYTFWIAGDDNAELWLSTTSNVNNKVKIAYHNSYTNPREWNKFTTQKSAAITLTAGQVYYVEALMKEGTGGDNMAVGWAKPGQATTIPGEVIPGARLLAQLADVQAPTPPANVTASVITQTTLTLTWTPATDNVGVTAYDIYQNNIKINTANIGTNSLNVTGLTASTQYSFYVVARDAAGNSSSASSSISITTTATDKQAPTVPANLSANNMGQTFFTLLWNASTDNVGVAGYEVYRNGTKITASSVTTASYAVTGLIPGTTYTLTVIAVDAAGNASTASAALNVTTLLPTPGTETFTQRTIIANQRMPHDLVYGPDNNIWYTERFAGTVSFVNPATGAKKVVLSLGAGMVRGGGQDGLMGLALHPQFNTGKPYVYISYTYQSTSTTVRKTRIERYTYNSTAQTLGSPVTILEDIPGSNDHNSSRLAVGPDLKLYYTVGDMGAGQFDNAARANNAQNLLVLEGKVLRLNTELTGSSWIPADNPYSNAGIKTPVYSFGHRNPQGLVWGTVNSANILYSSEHGPYSDDEMNIIEAGRNYGWPQVAGFCDGNYNGRTIGGFAVASEQNNCTALNVKEPIRSLFPVATPPTDATSNMTWPSTAPSGTEFYGSTGIPGWQNSLLVAQLKSGTITRFKLSNDGLSIISDTIHYFRGQGRFRDVVVSPDGLKIYVACDSSGSTSGPTGGVTSTPANPGSILEFTYQAPVGLRSFNQAIVQGNTTEDKNDRTIDVYPNPANDFIIVYSYTSQSGRSIELYDVTGKLVKKQTAMNVATRIETNNLAGGLYILKVKDAKGKLIRIEKIIIQR